MNYKFPFRDDCILNCLPCFFVNRIKNWKLSPFFKFLCWINAAKTIVRNIAMNGNAAEVDLIVDYTRSKADKTFLGLDWCDMNLRNHNFIHQIFLNLKGQKKRPSRISNERACVGIDPSEAVPCMFTKNNYMTLLYAKPKSSQPENYFKFK